MTNKNNLDYISAINSVVSDIDEKLSTMKRKVKHGKLKIQRKKIKYQVMKKHKPTDYDRESICKNARKKAHSVAANAKRNISNGVREGLAVVNPTSFTLSERYGLDFLEEAVGYDVEVKFFDKPEMTPITEGLTVGTTKSGKPKKCKAIGIAEGCFAPISTPEGERVFSRNHRLYAEDHWECQFENQNLLDRVSTRRMLGTIGHHDKKVDDDDLAKGVVSHIVTALEIREDEKHGRYLWGRLEIINTEAGRRLKEYYDNGIPLFVSSRGGGKLIDVPGQDYKMVDKNRYYCETFDVVKEPGFLEAHPEYHSESSDEMNELESLLREIAERRGLELDEAKLEALKNTLCESKDAELDEDNNMPKVNVDVTAKDSMETVVKKVIQPMQDETQKIVKSLAESIAELTATVSKIKSDIYEEAEAPAEDSVEKVSEEESAEVNAEEAEAVQESEEPKAEEPAVEEASVEEVAPAVEEVAEGKEDKEEKGADDKEAHDKDCKSEKCAGKKEDKKEEIKEEAEEPKVEEAPAEEVKPEAEAPAEEVAESTEETEKVEEQWAHQDPKETVTDVAKHEAPQGKPADALKGEVWANEPAPKVADMKKGETAPQEKDPTNHEETPAVKGAILEEETLAPAEKVQPAEAAEEQQEVIDYQAAYEEMKNDVEDATRLIKETTQMFEDFGKRHREVVAESKEIKESFEKRVAAHELELNSYKISEKFDVTIETAKEMLSTKSYEAVEEELKESEAKQIENETQAKAEEVSEAVAEEHIKAKAPVSREVYSAFATSKSEAPVEKIEESHETGRKVFSWFN